MKKYYNVVKASLYIAFVALPLSFLKMLLMVLGYPLVAIGLIKAEVMPTVPYEGLAPRKVDDSWKYVELRPKWIDNLWGSEKYGAEGNWFWNDDQDVTKFLPRWLWLANRNPVSNLTKGIPYYKKENINNNDIDYIGTLEYKDTKPSSYSSRLSWYDVDGFVAGWEFTKRFGSNKSIRLKLGFKLRPQDKDRKVNAFLSLNLAFNDTFN